MGKLYIRDDDTSYFTHSHELEMAYDDVWDRGCISLAVIPFDIPTQGRSNRKIFSQDISKEYPIGQNISLINLIIKKIKERKVYIMLHGYNHYYEIHNNNSCKIFVPEFVHKKNPLYYIQKGKDYLETLFNQEIKWFIPPSNALSMEALKACDKLRLNIPFVMGCKYRNIFSPWIIKNYLMLKFSLRTRKNPLLQFNQHKEILCHSFTKSSDWVNIENTYPKDKFIIATHYWEINQYKFIKSEIKKYVNLFGSVNSIENIG